METDSNSDVTTPTSLLTQTRLLVLQRWPLHKTGDPQIIYPILPFSSLISGNPKGDQVHLAVKSPQILNVTTHTRTEV